MRSTNAVEFTPQLIKKEPDSPSKPGYLEAEQALDQLPPIRSISHLDTRYSLLDITGHLYVMGEPPLSSTDSLVNANLIKELAHVFIEEVALGESNIGLLCCRRGSPTHQAFLKFGHTVSVQNKITQYQQNIVQGITTEKFRGLERGPGSSRRMSFRKDFDRRGSGISIKSNSSAEKIGRRTSTFGRRDSSKGETSQNKEKIASIFGNRLTVNQNLAPVQSIPQEPSATHSRSKTDGIKIIEPININASDFSEISQLQGSSLRNQSNCPPISLLGSKLEKKHIKLNGSKNDLSEKIMSFNSKIFEKEGSPIKSYISKSEFERKGLVKDSLISIGIENSKINEIINSTLETSVKVQAAEQNPDLIPFDEFGKDYYHKVSKMVIGSPDNQFYKPLDKKQVSDFFKHNSAHPREVYMELVKEGKMNSLMQSVLVHALDDLDKPEVKEVRRRKKRYKNNDSDDDMREKCKEEVHKAKNSVAAFTESIAKYSTQLGGCISEIRSSKSYCEKIISSVGKFY